MQNAARMRGVARPDRTDGRENGRSYRSCAAGAATFGTGAKSMRPASVNR